MRVVNIDAFANPMIELLGVTAVLVYSAFRLSGRDGRVLG